MLLLHFISLIFTIAEFFFLNRRRLTTNLHQTMNYMLHKIAKLNIKVLNVSISTNWNCLKSSRFHNYFVVYAKRWHALYLHDIIEYIYDQSDVNCSIYYVKSKIYTENYINVNVNITLFHNWFHVSNIHVISVSANL